MTATSDVHRIASEVRQVIGRQGWAYVPGFQSSEDDGTRLLEFAAALGDVFVPDSGGSPLVETACDPEAPDWEPFNRPEAIGWHNDFSTWNARPVLSLALVRRVPSDPRRRGDWRVVSCSDVVAALSANSGGRLALDLLRERPLPFVFASGEPALRFRVLDASPAPKVRFYGRAIRLGLMNEPNARATDAIQAWEDAADSVGRTIAVTTGALLVSDNWRSMHDRTEQGIGRMSRLAFVSAQRTASAA